MKELHFTFILNSVNRGGAELQLLEMLLKKPTFIKITVIILSGQSENDPKMLERYGSTSEVFFVPRKDLKFLKFIKMLYFIIKDLDPDFVHTLLDGSTATWGRLIAKMNNVPFIIHSDLSLSPKTTNVQRSLRFILDKWTDLFLPNAVTIRHALIKRGIPPEKITVVHNGVDTEKFTPVNRTISLSQKSKDGICVGFIGRFHPVKRIDLILDAVEKLPLNQRPARVLLVGDGEMMPVIRERVNSDPWLSKHVDLPGMVEDVVSFLSVIDVLVLCSDTEGLPNIILEAMSMGVPIIATSVADIPHLLNNIGTVIETNNSTALAAALVDFQNMTSNDIEAKSILSRTKVITEYSLERSLETFWNSQLGLINDKNRKV